MQWQSVIDAIVSHLRVDITTVHGYSCMGWQVYVTS